MADITQQSSGAFSAVVAFILGAFEKMNKVLISEGAAKARLKKVEMLNAKSDEELAMLGLRRENIISSVFFDNVDV